MGKGKHQKENTQNVTIESEAIFPNRKQEDDGTIVTTFSPVGTDHGLQDLITQGLHNAVKSDRTCTSTLAELGYLHFSTVEISNGRIQMKIFFDPRLCTNEVLAANGRKSLQIKPELIRLVNNRFVIVAQDSPGDTTINLEGIIGVEKTLAPQGKIKYDELGRPALYLKKDTSDMKSREVIVVYCNMMTALAYLLDIDMTAGYHISTVSASNRTNSDSKVMIDGYNEVHPVWITVRYTKNGYDPRTVVSYLRNLAESNRSVISHRKKILEEVKEETGKKKKKEKPEKASSSRASGW